MCEYKQTDNAGDYINANDTVRNKETEETKDVFMSWNEFQKYLEENPDLEKVITAPATVTHTGNIINKTRRLERPNEEY